MEVPGEEIVYLAVSAILDDGSRAEAVRFLRAPENLEEVDVDLVELYIAVTDRAGQPVRGLTQDDFEVWRRAKQEITKFELVREPAADRRHDHRHLGLDGRARSPRRNAPRPAS